MLPESDIFACDEVTADVKPGRRRITDAAASLAFIRGGKATVTLQSKKTGTRFTYRVTAADEGDTFFVALLSGPDNGADYRYLGRISRNIFWLGRKVPRPGDVTADAPSAKAFAWAWKALLRGSIPAELEVWHEGRCARCARKLTVPSSIESGFGPECLGKLGGL
jgi:hypothetical protein